MIKMQEKHVKGMADLMKEMEDLKKELKNIKVAPSAPVAKVTSGQTEEKKAAPETSTG